MKNLLLASVAFIALGVAPSFAQTTVVTTTDATTTAKSPDGAALAGGSAGGVAGAVAGGLIFGPIGAVIGGFAGATIGAEGGVAASSVDYVRLNPTEPVVIEGDVTAGYVVPNTVVIHKIQNDPKYGYFYTNDRAYIVDLSNNTIVYSPGTVVAATVTAQ